MKNDASMALSYPQNRTARRVWSYERLWFGKSITRSGPIKPSRVHDSDRNRNQQAVIVEHALQCLLGQNNHLTMDLPEQLNLFSRLLFDVATKFQHCLH